MCSRLRYTAKLLVGMVFLLHTADNVMADEKKADKSLAERGYAVLTTYCQKCHGDEFQYPGFDVRDRPSLMKQEPKPA